MLSISKYYNMDNYDHEVSDVYIYGTTYNVNNLFVEFIFSQNTLCATENLFFKDILSLKKTIKEIPKKYISPRICLVSIIQDVTNIKNVPPEILTEEICFIVITNRPSYLHNIPNNLKTEKVCIASVSKWGKFLKDIPYELQTQHICNTAMISDPSVFKYIDNKFKTNDLCWRASIWGLYNFVPAHKQTEGMRIVACQWNPHILKDFSSAEQSINVCLAAIEKNINTVRYIKNDNMRLAIEICHMNNFI